MFVKLYWIMPLISALMWISMLLAMLLVWIVQDHSEHYYFMDPQQHIAYISDIGAARLQPLFIAGSCVTVVLLDLSMIAERWLRHRGKLAPNTSWWQKGMSIIAILAAIVGAIGLILLSIYDTRQYPKRHDACLAVFIIGYVISAIFICAQYQRLGVHFREHAVLRASFWIKLIFIIVEIGLAIGFGVLKERGGRDLDASAILEWVVALIFTFYILTFMLDLLPAVKSSHHYSQEAMTELAGKGPSNGYGNGNVNDSYGGYADARPARGSRFLRNPFAR